MRIEFLIRNFAVGANRRAHTDVLYRYVVAIQVQALVGHQGKVEGKSRLGRTNLLAAEYPEVDRVDRARAISLGLGR